MGFSLGSRYRYGFIHRSQHPRDTRMDNTQLARTHRHCTYVSGTREGWRQSRGSHVGDFPRHTHRTSRTGRRLLHHTRRSAMASHTFDYQPCNGHRIAWRLHHCQLVYHTQTRKLHLRTLRRDMSNTRTLRCRRLARRRVATRLHCRRQRRGSVCRATNPR